jgi:DNA invertase Pin-like site-specific DNA recombinase
MNKAKSKTVILNIERTALPDSGMDGNPTREIIPIAPISMEAIKIRMAAYARVSSDSEDQLNSYLSQVKYYTTIISENENCTFVECYADEGLTGLDAGKRPDFQRMLRDCRAGKIDRILCKSVSRFARNFTECLEIIRELKRIGVSVLFEKERIDTAKMSGETLLAMHANAAQRESMSISSNLRKGIRMKMKALEFFPSSVPYGYRLNTKERRWDVIPEQAEVVRRIFNGYLSGKGMTEIAKELNRDGILRVNYSAKGRPAGRWTRFAVNYVLTNQSYTGNAWWQKTVSTDTVPIKKVKNTGQKPQLLIENNNPPIITHEDFDRVQVLLQKRRLLNTGKIPDGDNPLGKTVFCECGSSCRRKNWNGITYRICRTHDQSKENCPVTQIPEDEILAAYERMWNKLKRHKDEILVPTLELLNLAADRKYRGDAKISEIIREILSFIEQVNVLERLKGQGYIEPALYISQRRDIERKVTALRRAKAILMSEDDGSAVSGVEDLIEVLDTEDSAMEVFGEIIERCVIHARNTLTIRLLCGLEFSEPIERAVR